MTELEDLDRELEQLSGLAKDCHHGSARWEVVWRRIDRLLEERGKIVLEVGDD